MIVGVDAVEEALGIDDAACTCDGDDESQIGVRVVLRLRIGGEKASRGGA